MSGDTELLGEMNDVEVDLHHARSANRDNWDDRAAVHADSALYDVERLLGDPQRLSDTVARDLPVLTPYLPGGSLLGRSVVHLQCHIGTDTLSLARRGARVTGVDFSPRSLAIARDLAGRAGGDVHLDYVEADVVGAAAAVGTEVDVVYTSIGTICWLPDLDAWARNIVALLRPGGVFYFHDSHPMLHTLDELGESRFTVRTRYFGDGFAQTYDQAGTYTDGDHTRIRHTRNYEWPHPISETVQALLDAGLRLRLMTEGRTLPWKALPEMVPAPTGTLADGQGYVLPRPWDARIPLTYTLIASKD